MVQIYLAAWANGGTNKNTVSFIPIILFFFIRRLSQSTFVTFFFHLFSCFSSRFCLSFFFFFVLLSALFTLYRLWPASLPQGSAEVRRFRPKFNSLCTLSLSLSALTLALSYNHTLADTRTRARICIMCMSLSSFCNAYHEKTQRWTQFFLFFFFKYFFFRFSSKAQLRLN